MRYDEVRKCGTETEDVLEGVGSEERKIDIFRDYQWVESKNWAILTFFKKMSKESFSSLQEISGHRKILGFFIRHFS